MQALLQKLKNMQTNQVITEFLGQNFPCLFVFVMKQRGMLQALSEYMEKCKNLEKDDVSQFRLYVHGYWIPWLQEQRELGLLKQGKVLNSF